MGQVSTRPFGVVTGGSSGIGKELARQFVQNGFDVLIVADTEKVEQAQLELQQLDGARIYAQKIDLATPDGVDRLWDVLQGIGRPIEAIALNAGIGVDGPFTETSLDDE